MLNNARSIPIRNAVHRALMSNERVEPHVEHTDEYRFNAMMKAARQEAKRKAMERARLKAIEEENQRKARAKEAERRRAIEEENRRKAIEEAARRREKAEKDAKRNALREIVRQRAIEAGEAYSPKKPESNSSEDELSYEMPQNIFKRNVRPGLVSTLFNLTQSAERLPPEHDDAKNGLEVDKGNGAVLSQNGSPDGPNGAVVKSGRYS